jgi:hypothetical protein
MMVDYYFIYDDAGTPIATDHISMARWLTNKRRRVAGDQIGTLSVSTVFLGINHQWGAGPPILWETMVFGLPSDVDEIQLRYSSRADALEGHKRACDEIRMAIRGNEAEFAEALSAVRATDSVRKCCARIQRRLG